MEESQIFLKETNWNGHDYHDMVKMMNCYEGIKDVFYGRQDRIFTTTVSWMIRNDDKNIGFINLVEEKANPNFLFLDMGIIKKYRNKGIGTNMLRKIEKMLEIDFPYVIMETEKENYGANQSALKIGCFLTSVEDRNVYLLQKNRYQEFIENNQLEELKKHYETPSRRKVLR